MKTMRKEMSREKINRTKFSKLFAILMAFVLFWGFGFHTSYAKTDSGVAASSLSVYLTAGGETKLVHDYSIGEIVSLIDGTSVKYSSTDAMPARVLTVGDGVYIDTLIANLANYTDADTSNFEKIKITATDGWSRTYTKADLFATKYYYGDLFNTSTWDSSVGKTSAAVANNGVAVKPMLAVYSWQSRVTADTDDVSSLIGEMTGETMFRLCLGMSPSDLTSGSSTTSEYGKWVNKIELVMSDAGQAASGQETTSQTTSAAWQNNFADVAEKDWYYSAVEFVNSNDLFQGTDADSFSPNSKMTRGMFVTVLGRMAKADTGSYTNNFSDVAQGKYYEGYVAWASGSDLVSGYGGEFKPDNLITREQMALIMYRYAKLAGEDVSNTDNTKCLTFSDYEDTMSGAKEAVCWAVNHGIMAGSNGKLEPKGEASRAQVAQIMKNFSESVDK